MARPEKNNVDYFPFYCEEGKKMFYLEETYGNDGFATFIKLLRELAKSEYHYLDLSKNTTLMFLSAKCKISKETLVLIINDLVDLEKFDLLLWSEYKIIWCQDFVDSIQDAYSKRNNKCITYEGLLLLLPSLRVRKLSKLPPNDTTSTSQPSYCIENEDSNTQSIVEYSIVKKRKEEESKEKDILLGEKFNDIIKIFNSVCVNLPKIQKITAARKSAIINREKEYDLATIGTVFKNVADSRFCNGENNNGWKADFDWILNPNNFIKILENKYANNGNRNHFTAKSDSEVRNEINNVVDKMFG